MALYLGEGRVHLLEPVKIAFFELGDAILSQAPDNLVGVAHHRKHQWSWLL